MAFTYRKPVIINQEGIVQVTLTYEPGMNSDFSDVRFIADDETTEFDYKRVSYSSGSSAVFLVDVYGANAFIYFGDSSLSYTSTWEPPSGVVQEITHEKSYTKDSSNPVIPLGSSGQWDDYSVYGVAPIEVSGTIYAFYSGNRNEGSVPEHEGSVGLATSTDGHTFTKQGMVVDKNNISGIVGLTPFTVIDISGTYYMFVTAYYSSGAAYRVGYLTSSDLSSWSGLTLVTGLDAASHAPHVMEDPTDNTKLLIYYTAMGSTKTIKRATAAKSDPSSWSNNTGVISGSALYPFVKYENSQYKLFYAKPNSTTFTLMESISNDGLSFSQSSMQVIPNGGSGAWDEGYIATPRVIGDKLFFSGRYLGGDIYKGIGLAVESTTGSLSGWSYSVGTVQVQSTQAHSGTYGGALTGGSTNPEIHVTALGKNKTYEVWIYDDANTGSGRQITFRPYGGGGTAYSNLIGVDTATSTSKYVYRKKSGSYTATTINRTAGWHKLSYVVSNSDLKAYIDDVLIYTDTGYNVDLLQDMALYGKTSGTYYFDDYKVTGETSYTGAVQVGTELL